MYRTRECNLGCKAADRSDSRQKKNESESRSLQNLRVEHPLKHSAATPQIGLTRLSPCCRFLFPLNYHRRCSACSVKGVGPVDANHSSLRAPIRRFAQRTNRPRAEKVRLIERFEPSPSCSSFLHLARDRKSTIGRWDHRPLGLSLRAGWRPQ